MAYYSASNDFRNWNGTPSFSSTTVASNAGANTGGSGGLMGPIVDWTSSGSTGAQRGSEWTSSSAASNPFGSRGNLVRQDSTTLTGQKFTVELPVPGPSTTYHIMPGSPHSSAPKITMSSRSSAVPSPVPFDINMTTKNNTSSTSNYVPTTTTPSYGNGGPPPFSVYGPPPSSMWSDLNSTSSSFRPSSYTSMSNGKAGSNAKVPTLPEVGQLVDWTTSGGSGTPLASGSNLVRHDSTRLTGKTFTMDLPVPSSSTSYHIMPGSSHSSAPNVTMSSGSSSVPMPVPFATNTNTTTNNTTNNSSTYAPISTPSHGNNQSQTFSSYGRAPGPTWGSLNSASNSFHTPSYTPTTTNTYGRKSSGANLSQVGQVVDWTTGSTGGNPFASQGNLVRHDSTRLTGQKFTVDLPIPSPSTSYHIMPGSPHGSGLKISMSGGGPSAPSHPVPYTTSMNSGTPMPVTNSSFGSSSGNAGGSSIQPYTFPSGQPMSTGIGEPMLSRRKSITITEMGPVVDWTTKGSS